MKLLLDERNLIVGISGNIEFGVWGNVGTAESWKIGSNSYTMDNNHTVVDIGDTEIPTYVKEGEYYYIDGEFKLGDECPNEYKEKIAELTAINEELQIQLAEQAMTLEVILTEIIPSLGV